MDTRRHNGKKIRFPLSESRPGLVHVTCGECGEEFLTYPSLVKNLKSTTCSDKCAAKRRKNRSCKNCGGKVGYRMSHYCSYACRKSFSEKPIRRKAKSTGFFSRQIESYEDKIIDYKGSPTKNKAYIGIAKRPLMPVKKGFGYMGVLIQSSDREFVQCHGCGEWFRKIGDMHTKKCLGKTTKEYKQMFGLNEGPGLVSDATSMMLTQNALKAKENIERFIKDSKNGKMQGRRGRDKPQRIAFSNIYGTCPLQLQERLYEFIRVNKELPSQSNRGRPIYKALTRRYKSFGEALQAHGLPRLKRRGTNMQYTFPDHTVYKYNINRIHDRAALYALMMEKCPVLHEKK